MYSSTNSIIRNYDGQNLLLHELDLYKINICI